MPSKIFGKPSSFSNTNKFCNLNRKMRTIELISELFIDFHFIFGKHYLFYHAMAWSSDRSIPSFKCIWRENKYSSSFFSNENISFRDFFFRKANFNLSQSVKIFWIELSKFRSVSFPQFTSDASDEVTELF